MRYIALLSLGLREVFCAGAPAWPARTLHAEWTQRLLALKQLEQEIGSTTFMYALVVRRGVLAQFV